MTERDKILLIANNAAVDATIYTKGDAIETYSKVKQISLENIAGIGDEILDISFLTTEGLGFVGAPANAQEPVLSTVRQLANGWTSEKEEFNAFLEFYNLARNRGITHVVSDRDGVIFKDGDYSRGPEFKKLLENIGIDGNPHIAVLTGSAYVQNVKFMKEYGMTSELKSNPAIVEDPYLLLAESGLIQVDVLTGKTKNLCTKLNEDLLKRLRQEFEPVFKERMARPGGVLWQFGLEWSNDYTDQKGKIYVPPKQSMATFNIPRQFPDGKEEYRKSTVSVQLRKAIIQVMEGTAKDLKIPYSIVRN